MKPYIFNNYEKTLPQQKRGFYQSFQVNKDPKPHLGVKKRDGILLTVDLTDVKSKQDIFERFYKKLALPYELTNLSWDAFGDYLWFMKDSSAIFSEIDPQVIHLRVNNLNHVWDYSPEDYTILCEILITSTDNSRFKDGFRMIVEINNENQLHQSERT